MKKYIKGFFIWDLNCACISTVWLSWKESILSQTLSDDVTLLIILLVWFLTGCAIIIAIANYGEKRTNADKKAKHHLLYSFIDNSILLSTEKIMKNGFCEVWRQESDEHSIQILCFNPETEEFQAFDRFHWMNEPRIPNTPDWLNENGCLVFCDSLTDLDGTYWEEDLWTPIKLHFTEEWLKEHIIL